ncbi:MAG: hypothetical protein CR978_02205 [Gammaproteobacteria bacterium]|nr:MAG: hypothetical protein CR978_02205 [Gammaproteobacteria bacterium]
MKTFLHRLLAALLMLVSALVHAGSGCVVSSEARAENAAVPSCESLYPSARYGDDLSPWRVGIAVGYGQRENPLVNGEDVPVYGGLQLSYFGEYFFFDNGDVGWFVGSGEHWDINAIAGLGSERVFFSHFNRAGFGFLGVGVDQVESGDTTISPLPEKDPDSKPIAQQRERPPRRGLTVDAGLEWLYYRGGVEVQAQLLTDVSGRHDGQELWLSAAYHLKRGRWSLSPGLGLVWKSSQAANYFYGVRAHEVNKLRAAYKAGDALTGFARINVAYRLNDHWQVLGLWQASAFDDSISKSPWVAEDTSQAVFFGVYYEF